MKKALMTLAAALAAPAAALAHPGHGFLDEGPRHAMTSPYHLLAAVAFVGIVVAIGQAIRYELSRPPCT